MQGGGTACVNFLFFEKYLFHMADMGGSVACTGHDYIFVDTGDVAHIAVAVVAFGVVAVLVAVVAAVAVAAGPHLNKDARQFCWPVLLALFCKCRSEPWFKNCLFCLFLLRPDTVFLFFPFVLFLFLFFFSFSSSFLFSLSLFCSSSSLFFFCSFLRLLSSSLFFSCSFLSDLLTFSSGD